ncbi:MAG: hypothetical protein KDB04_13925 [Acidimicrobiales bacterium]|nr:hypothetical protein [Acidimicrobiales bacterium]HRW38685.1 hypothetical protein [Aquihabitans sp.]
MIPTVLTTTPDDARRRAMRRRRGRRTIAVALAGSAAVVAVVLVGVGVIEVSLGDGDGDGGGNGNPAAVADRVPGVDRTVDERGYQEVRSGEGTVVGRMVPLGDVGLVAPSPLPRVRSGMTVEMSPPDDVERVTITEPSSGATFAGFATGTIEPGSFFPQSGDPCEDRAWTWHAEPASRLYFEGVVFCRGVGARTPTEFLEAWTRDQQAGTIEVQELDGRPSARVTSLLARRGGIWDIWSTQVVQLEGGWLVAYVATSLFENSAAPDLDPLVSTIEVP